MLEPEYAGVWCGFTRKQADPVFFPRMLSWRVESEGTLVGPTAKRSDCCPAGLGVCVSRGLIRCERRWGEKDASRTTES